MPNILLESPNIAVGDKGDSAQAYTECVFGYGESLSKTEARYIVQVHRHGNSANFIHITIKRSQISVLF